MTEKPTPGRHFGTLLLADISGYTAFLDSVRVAHQDAAFADGRTPDAYAMMSSFLQGIASTIDPPFWIVKFEGDAVFAVAEESFTPRGRVMIDLIGDCYRDFVARRDAAGLIWTCTCAACSGKGTLDLKFIIHHGEFFVQTIGTQVEAVGPDVNIAHRLLKNGAVEAVHSHAYALFTSSATDDLGLMLSEAVPLIETIDGSRDIATLVTPLDVQAS